MLSPVSARAGTAGFRFGGRWCPIWCPRRASSRPLRFLGGLYGLYEDAYVGHVELHGSDHR